MTASPVERRVPQFDLADRLRKIRRELRLSQDTFAERLGVKAPRYGAWEAGRNQPENIVDLARRVEAVTGVPAWWTLGVGPDDSGHWVRHQGLEPRTRWFGRTGERRGFMPIAVPGAVVPHPRRRVVVPSAARPVRQPVRFRFVCNEVADPKDPRWAVETTAATFDVDRMAA